MKQFNGSLYGAILRLWRTQKGFKTAKAFSSHVKKETGVSVPTETIYKIEQGKQLPTVNQCVAFYLATHDRSNIDEATRALPQFFEER